MLQIHWHSKTWFKLRFLEFTKVWKSTKIGEIADIVGGGTPRTEVEEYWDGEIRWFTPSEIGKTKYIFDSKRHITDKGLKNSSAKLLPKDTILLSSRATVGEISIALTECSTNQGFQSLITKNNVDNDFIYYLISTIKNEFLRRSSGSTFLEISKNEIKRIPINIPELSEQNKISNLFSAIDNKIEMLEKKHQYYQDFKKYLMQRIFSSQDDKLRFNFDDEWKQYKLKDVLTVKSSSISINQLEENTGDYPLYGASGFLKNIDFCEMDVDYISIVKDGSGVGNLSFHEKNSSIVNTSQYLLPKKNFNINFLYYLLQTINLMKYVNGSSIPHIYFKDYCIEKINIPSLDEQEKIGKLFVDVDITMENLNKNINATQEFKKGLLQQMFVVRINWRCNFKLAKSPSFNKHLLILKNKIIFIIIK